MALVPVLLAGCSRAEAGSEVSAGDLPSVSPLPMVIHGMPLVGVIAGDQAETLAASLHGRPVTSAESYVGRYEGGGAEATLYLTRVAEKSLADSLVDRMAGAIGTGTPRFGHHTVFQAGDVEVHAVLGRGQEHFFYARDRDVAWLATDRGMARAALADLLGLGMDRLPARIVLDGIDVLPPPDSLYPRPRPRNPEKEKSRS